MSSPGHARPGPARHRDGQGHATPLPRHVESRESSFDSSWTGNHPVPVESDPPPPGAAAEPLVAERRAPSEACTAAG